MGQNWFNWTKYSKDRKIKKYNNFYWQTDGEQGTSQLKIYSNESEKYYDGCALDWAGSGGRPRLRDCYEIFGSV